MSDGSTLKSDSPLEGNISVAHSGVGVGAAGADSGRGEVGARRARLDAVSLRESEAVGARADSRSVGEGVLARESVLVDARASDASERCGETKRKFRSPSATV